MGLTGCRTTVDFPIDKLASAQWSGMLTGSIVMFASGNKAEIQNVSKADGKRIVDILRARRSAPPASSHPRVRDWCWRFPANVGILLSMLRGEMER